MNRKLPVLIALVGVAALPASAQAKSFAVDGYVVAPPSAGGGAVTVPVLLSDRSERRLRLGAGLVRARLPRNSSLPVTGAANMSPTALRVGDRLQGRTSLTKKSRNKLRKRALPTLRVSRAKVPSRASALSVDELTALVNDLRASLGAMSTRVDGLNSTMLAGFSFLQSEIEALQAQLAGLTDALDSLTLSFTQLELALQSLTGIVNPVVLTTLISDVQSLLDRVTDLETLTTTLQTTLGTLQTTVAGLGTTLTGLQGTVSGLTTQVTALSTSLTGALGQLSGLVTQVAGLESALGGLDGRLDVVEALLGGINVGTLSTQVNAIDTTVDGLLGTVGQQGTDLTNLTNTVTGLGTSLGTTQSGLTALQGQVDGLDDTVTGLVSDVAGLQSTVAGICALPIITVVC